MTPRVLMIVPTLGRRMAYLEHCLASIAAQDVATDLVVVGPATPELEEITRRHGGRLLADPERGMCAALNAGFGSAVPGTPYVAWLGDDDVLTDGSLAATTAALDADPGASMVYGWCDYIDDEGAVVFANRAGRMAGRTITFAPNLVPQPGSLMRLPEVLRVGGVDERLTFSMDLDLFLRLRRRGHLLALQQTLACFRWHVDSVTVASEGASAEEADRVRMRYLPAPVAALYRLGRWPGRWALRLVKWRVRRQARRVATAGS